VRFDRRIVVTIICIILSAIVWLAFGEAVACGFVDYDDNTYVYNNPAITKGLTIGGIQWAFTHFHANNWHPLTTISHMLDARLYGLEPWGHHLTNILLHIGAAILLFLALRRLTDRRSEKDQLTDAPVNNAENVWPSALVAALFAVHPLRVESVVWISERKDVLSGIFFMLTLWAYAGYSRANGLSCGRYVLVVVFFGLGLMCKSTLVTVPFLLLLLDYWPLGRMRRDWSVVGGLIVEKIPFVILSAFSCIATALAQKDVLTKMRELPLAGRLANAVISYVTYLRQMIYPTHLAVFYPFPRGPHVFGTILGLLLLLSLSVIFFLWRRKHPFLLVGWLWFIGMLVPMLGIVQVGQQSHADRYTYLPMIGLYLLVVWMAIDISNRWQHSRRMLSLMAALIIVALVADSYGQTQHWENSKALWQHAVDVTSDNYVAHYSLGNVFAQRKQFAEATAQFRESIRIEPYYVQAHNNLAIALANQGKYGEAIAEYRTALRLRPDLAEVYNNLGTMLATIGKPEEAIRALEASLRVQPNYVEAHLNLARVLEQVGRRREAVTHLAAAMQLREHKDRNK
jgi:protein O-mannosyl-transferase